MQKVLPLKRWKKHKLPEREHFSDQDSDSEDEEDECLDDEEFEIPRKQRKSKRKPKPKPAKKRKIRIPKKDAGVSRPPSNAGVKRARTDPPGPPPGPPPKRIRGNEMKPSQIVSRK